MRVPDSTTRASAEILAGAWADEHHSDIGGGQIFASAASLARAILHLCTAVSAQRCTALHRAAPRTAQRAYRSPCLSVPPRASPCLLPRSHGRGVSLARWWPAPVSTANFSSSDRTCYLHFFNECDLLLCWGPGDQRRTPTSSRSAIPSLRSLV